MANSNGWGDGASNNLIGWGQGADNAIGWGDSHLKSWAGATDIAGFDSSAISYFNATGISGATQQDAIDNLIRGLKDDGIWSKMKAVYPFVTDNRNRLDYTEDFSNAVWAKNGSTVTTNTITAPNGTLTADTLLDGTSNTVHYVSTVKNAFGQNGNNTSTIYAKANTLNYLWMYFYNGSEAGGVSAFFNLSNGTLGTVQSGITATIENAGNGWYRCSITRNFNFSAAFSDCGYGVSNADNVFSYLGTNKSIYIWGAQVENGSTATTYQPITTTQQAFIANQFKYNLVNPLDTDAAFRLVFNGGWTHSSNGATPNGTNGYADTKLNPFTRLSQSSAHNAHYFRSSLNTNSTGYGVVKSDYTERMDLIRFTDILYSAIGNQGQTSTSSIPYNSLICTSRTSLTSNKLYKAGILLDTKTDLLVSNLPNFNYYLAAVNQSGFTNLYTSNQLAFSSIGDGLTDTEAANLYTRVQAFQTALSRNI
jgi:hypothetical protein